MINNELLKIATLIPVVFISYTYDSPEPNAWVETLPTSKLISEALTLILINGMRGKVRTYLFHVTEGNGGIGPYCEHSVSCDQ